MNEIYEFKSSFTADPRLAEVYYYLEQLDFETSYPENHSQQELLEKLNAARGLIVRIKAVISERSDLPETLKPLFRCLGKLIEPRPLAVTYRRKDLTAKIEAINQKASDLEKCFIDGAV